MSTIEDLWRELDTANTESKHRDTLKSDMLRFGTIAYEHYKLMQLDSALTYYRKAFDCAVKLGDNERQAKYKGWEGYCLQRLDRLMEALTALMEQETIIGKPRDHWNGLIGQIEIAQSIPISLENINRIVQRTAEEMVRNGLQKSQSMLLRQECFLLFDRGNDNEALAKAQEALAIYGNVYPRYNVCRHYNDLIIRHLEVGDRANAELWLKRYEGVDTPFECDKEQNILNIRRRLALLDGKKLSANRYAQRALAKAREGNKHPYFELYAFIDTGIQCDTCSILRPYLAELLYYHRNSENGHCRYRIRCLVGDYHRAMYRAAEPYSADAQKHLNLARRYYGYALKVGQFLDQRLVCDWRTKQMRERLGSLH